jgi:hypothetical protein
VSALNGVMNTVTLASDQDANRAQTTISLVGRWLARRERAVLERMRALRRKPVKQERRSYQTIADTLNSEGLLNREGRPWSASRILAVLKQAAIVEQRQQQPSHPSSAASTR